jgi:hypothetical protein
MTNEVTEHSLIITGTRERPIEWTVKEYAAIERVSERTVWTWVAKQAVPVRRTPGGRVRILARAF